MGARPAVGHAEHSVVERRDALTAMTLQLAATADSVAAVLRDVARSRDDLASTSRRDPERLRIAAHRARELAAKECDEAARLRRTVASAPVSRDHRDR
jgi:hypothetical protein